MSRLLRWVVFVLWRAPFRWRRRRAQRRELKRAVRARSAGFDLRCGRELESRARDLVETVVSALALIQRVDPRRFAWIRTHMPRFFIASTDGPAYWTAFNTCVLDARLVSAGVEVDIADAIVHEAAHARIERAGIRWWPDLWERIEARCVREQIAFMLRLKAAGWNVDARVEWYRQRLTGPLVRINHERRLAERLHESEQGRCHRESTDV